MSQIVAPEMRSSLQDRAAWDYVCPRTRLPLSAHEHGLTRPDGARYAFLRGWNGVAIPDFLILQEVGGAGTRSLDMYDTALSVAQYRNFLGWLFETFHEDESAFRQSLISHLKVKAGARVLITGCGLGDDIPPVLAATGPKGELY